MIYKLLRKEKKKEHARLKKMITDLVELATYR